MNKSRKGEMGGRDGRETGGRWEGDGRERWQLAASVVSGVRRSVLIVMIE